MLNIRDIFSCKIVFELHVRCGSSTLSTKNAKTSFSYSTDMKSVCIASAFFSYTCLFACDIADAGAFWRMTVCGCAVLNYRGLQSYDVYYSCIKYFDSARYCMRGCITYSSAERRGERQGNMVEILRIFGYFYLALVINGTKSICRCGVDSSICRCAENTRSCGLRSWNPA